MAEEPSRSRAHRTSRTVALLLPLGMLFTQRLALKVKSLRLLGQLRAQGLEFLSLRAELGDLSVDAPFLSRQLMDDALLFLLRDLARLRDPLRVFF